MHQPGHYGAALVVYAPTAAVLLAFGLEPFAVIGGLISVGLAMAPDLDMRVPGVKHRGITHTVHFAVIMGAVLAAGGLIIGLGGGGDIGTVAFLTAFGFVVGFGTIASHIAADALTPMGVKPFRNGRQYSLDLVKAANPIANYLLLAVGIGAVGLAGALGLAIAG